MESFNEHFGAPESNDYEDHVQNQAVEALTSSKHRWCKEEMCYMWNILYQPIKFHKCSLQINLLQLALYGKTFNKPIFTCSHDWLWHPFVVSCWEIMMQNMLLEVPWLFNLFFGVLFKMMLEPLLWCFLVELLTAGLSIYHWMVEFKMYARQVQPKWDIYRCYVPLLGHIHFMFTFYFGQT